MKTPTKKQSGRTTSRRKNNVESSKLNFSSFQGKSDSNKRPFSSSLRSASSFVKTGRPAHFSSLREKPRKQRSALQKAFPRLTEFFGRSKFHVRDLITFIVVFLSVLTLYLISHREFAGNDCVNIQMQANDPNTDSRDAVVLNCMKFGSLVKGGDGSQWTWDDRSWNWVKLQSGNSGGGSTVTPSFNSGGGGGAAANQGGTTPTNNTPANNSGGGAAANQGGTNPTDNTPANNSGGGAAGGGEGGGNIDVSKLTTVGSYEVPKTTDANFCCWSTGFLGTNGNWFLFNDQGYVLEATPTFDSDKKINGLTQVKLQKMKNVSGKEFSKADDPDIEAACLLKDNSVLVMHERKAAWFVYKDVSKNPVLVNAPTELVALTQGNSSQTNLLVEGVCCLPSSGDVICMTEGRFAVSGKSKNVHHGWRGNDGGADASPARFTFKQFYYENSTDLLVSDLACSSDGTRIFILERLFNSSTNIVTCRVSYFNVSSITENATVTSTLLINISPTPFPSENYEILLFDTKDSKKYLFCMSDDNKRASQKTIITQTAIDDSIKTQF